MPFTGTLSPGGELLPFMGIYSTNKTVASALSRYAAVGGPNQVMSASASPSWVGSPTQAT